MPWQPAGLLFPDAELLMTTRIRAALVTAGETGVYVGNRIPTTRQTRMVIWNRDGGAISGVFDHPRMRCRVWDATDQKAIDLARRVVALVLGMPDGTTVTEASHESGPYDVPDESGQPQKYLLFTIATRGVPS